MVLAAWLSTSFVIISISSYYLLRNAYVEFAKKCIKFGVIAVTIIAPLQIGLGDIVGIHVYEHQPLKTGAMEGIWNTENGAPTILFALPSNQEQRNLFELGHIPHGSAILNTQHYNGQLIGLKTVSPKDQPEVWPIFFSFRIMVGIGIFMLCYGVMAMFMLLKGKLYTSKNLLYVSQFLAPIGFIALLTGWFSAEIGRQPWAVYELNSYFRCGFKCFQI